MIKDLCRVNILRNTKRADNHGYILRGSSRAHDKQLGRCQNIVVDSLLCARVLNQVGRDFMPMEVI